MKPIQVLAAAAVSALGRGSAAYSVGELGEVARSGLTLDAGLSGVVDHPRVGRVALDACPEPADRAERLLLQVAADLAGELDALLRNWRELRIGVLIGTSSGAMGSIQEALALRASGHALSPELAARASYFAPLQGLPTCLGVAAPAVQLLAACASSTLAIGLGCRWLDAGCFDLVIAGGYDALSTFVAAGFDSLGALTHGMPRPFRADRDGMALGEGAALLALSAHSIGSAPLGQILGFGSSSDAIHVTAPDRSGSGLLRAATAALQDAEIPATRIDLVSAHGTATPFNDAAEARALTGLFSDRAMQTHVFKSAIGHTLGAAGALETLAALDALRRNVAPADLGDGPLCSEARVLLPPRNESCSLDLALKLSAGFGGINAALVLASPRVRSRARRRPAHAVVKRNTGSWVEAADPELVRGFAPGAERLTSRADSLSELVLAAIARVLQTCPVLGPRTGIVVGTQSATLELDDVFDARLRAGAPLEPRRFPATSPNLCAGLCSIAFGFQGPSFSVGSGPDAARDALHLGYDLIAAGDANPVLIVRAEDSAGVVRDLFGAAGVSVPRRGAQALLLAASDGEGGIERAQLSW